MKIETAKRLHDALEACNEMLAFTNGRTFEEYERNRLLQLGVERLFEILGEALNAASREDQSLIRSIPDSPMIVGLRNRIAHGYADISNARLWDAAAHSVPELRAVLLEILEDAPPIV